MTDWLSGIETYNKKQRDNSSMPIILPETLDERMARVLRELADYIEYCRPAIVADKITKWAYISLSDDAKELLK